MVPEEKGPRADYTHMHTHHIHAQTESVSQFAVLLIPPVEKKTTTTTFEEVFKLNTARMMGSGLVLLEVPRKWLFVTVCRGL